jgi:pyruvate formate lyase activating enzyme
MKGYIHSYETFGTVDGPGIRFVVFFQGCPMRCLYCHNPDTWTPNQGNYVTVEEILEQYDNQKEFYKTGGITATGGEPMVQLEFLTELFTKAKAKGIHTCLDSSGIMFNPENTDKYLDLIKVTDLVMLDIKHIDDEKHFALTSQHNDRILKFAKFISDSNVEIWIRHVVVPDLTDNPKYLYRLGQFISQLKTLKALDVLPYHDMGKVKYEELGIDYKLKDTKPLEKEKAIAARNVIMQGLKDALKGINNEPSDGKI